jgi:hypothetical protein
MGLEPTTFSLGNNSTSDVSTSFDSDLHEFSRGPVAPLGAQKSDAEQADPELARLVAAWPSLPPAVRAGITAMVDAAATDQAER